MMAGVARAGPRVGVRGLGLVEVRIGDVESLEARLRLRVASARRPCAADWENVSRQSPICGPP